MPGAVPIRLGSSALAHERSGPNLGRLFGWALAAMVFWIVLSSPLERMGGTRGTPVPQSPSRGLALESVPLPLQSAVSTALGHSERAFAARRSSAGWRLAGGGVRASFSGRRVQLTAHGESLSMALVAVGRGRRLGPVGGQPGRGRRNRISFDRGDVREWYAAGPLGIEQGFTVRRRPFAGRGGLRLTLGLHGSIRAVASRSLLRFATRSGRVWLRYGGLSALDSSGRRLPASFALRKNRLLVSVDDRRARYPVRIDPLIQQGATLTPNDEDTEGQFGFSVALSADGNTALIGGPDDGNSDVGPLGAAWVFTRSAVGVWTQQGSKLTPTDEDGNAQFGSSVALSADGSTALIGGLDETAAGGGGAIGAAWVFIRAGGVWTQLGSKLAPSDESGNGQFGASVALSSNGTTALIGGPFDNNSLGAAWVFIKSNNKWVQNGAKLTVNGSDEVGGAQFGASVALSSDGQTALIGGPFDDSSPDNAGAAWVFVATGSTMTQQGPKLTPNDNASFAKFGAGVALSSDGNTAVIGGPDDNSFAGAAWTFTRAAAAWTQQGAKLVPTDESGNAEFGTTVALSASGTTALIGGPDDDGLGATWQFAGSSGALTQQGPKLTPTGEIGSAGSGWAVALSSDGDTALTGGPFDNARAGGAWVFTPPAPNCVNVTSATPAGGGAPTVQLACTGAPGANLSYAIVAQPAHGQLGAIAQGSGQVTYTSQDGFNGQDSFTYQATDQWGETSNVATVTIAVPPAAPVCTDTTASTPAGGGQVTVTLLCTPPPGVALSYAIVAGPAHGVLSAINQTNGEVTYVSGTGQTGSDTFSYQASDPGGTSNTATANITIPPPPPVPAAPVCTDTTARTPAGGGQVTVTLLCTPPPGVALSYAIVAGPAHGILSAINQTNGEVNYVSGTGQTGSDAFSYQASDPGGTSNTATANITIPSLPPPPPTPVASIVGPIRALVGQQTTYRASVIDSAGTPNAYRWTLAGKQIGTQPTLKFAFGRPGREQLGLQVGDTRANTIDASLDVNVTSPRLKISLPFNATYSIPPAYSVFTSIIAQAVPIGTRIDLSCEGQGCPLAHRSITVTGATRCHRATCKPKHEHGPAHSRSVDLTSVLQRARLHIGAHLAVRFQKRLYIGQVDFFTFHAKGPVLRKACLPPGKSAPANRC